MDGVWRGEKGGGGGVMMMGRAPRTNEGRHEPTRAIGYPPGI
ncbi:hypothetical protein C900_03823 [Fulvivirga imtechensis AK7]|uniref:Uncharacterized protein n=1 Tax=Fulvivirga imtechensis AK7 TaxID=1237149 RepID=L8JPJ9_9BACT|nr:hypothetical protein C900_03823 [Fulvivirga imtechensis AK7]